MFMESGWKPISDFYLLTSLSIFFLSILIAIVVAVKKLDIVRPLRIFGIGLVISDWTIFLFLLKILFPELNFMSVVAGAIMNTAQMVTVNLDYIELIGAAASNTGVLFFFAILCVFTPIIWGGVVLTMFEKFSSWSTYQIFRMFVPVYFFSELNEKSLMLARSLKKDKRKRCLCIFCGVGESISSDLKENAKDEAFLLFRKTELSFVKSPKHPQVYFEISSNQDENISSCRGLISSYVTHFEKADFSKIKIFLFSEQDTAALLLSSTDKKGLPVTIVARDRFFANELMFAFPLYKVLSASEKTISLLIVGAGRTGITILRTAVWCGQLGSDYRLRITVIDKDANYQERAMRLECPELFCGEYVLSFFDADVNTCDFESCLVSHCENVNYVCVCGDSDESNIRTAIYIRSHYLRKNLLSDTKPFIAVEVRNEIKNATVSEFTAITRERLVQKKILFTSDEALNYNIHPFGGNNELYSARLLDLPLEKLALNVHFAYEQAFSEGAADENEARRFYYSNEANTRSDRANALHARYKLFLLGYDIKNFESASDAEVLESPRLLQELRTKTDKLSLTLSKIEHDRWNAFMRSEGWRVVPLETATEIGKHKFPRAKMHGCLCTWDELDLLAEFDPKFKEYDEILIKSIPVIYGLEDSTENISGIRYVLVRKNTESITMHTGLHR